MNAGTGGGPEPQTAAALEARRASAQAALQRVHDTLTRMRREKTPITIAAVGRRASVSRTFLYSNPDARTAVADAAAASGLRQAAGLAAQDTAQEATWRERALNAEGALKAARAEILQQRNRIGELMGQVRDLEAEWTEEAIQRITTENTTLKQRVRHLTTDNRTLDERLKAPAPTCASRTAASPTSKPASPNIPRLHESRSHHAAGELARNPFSHRQASWLERRRITVSSGCRAIRPALSRLLGSYCDQAHRIGCPASSQSRKLSRLPFHSSRRVTARTIERRTTRCITVRRGRSSQTTVSARCQSRSPRAAWYWSSVTQRGPAEKASTSDSNSWRLTQPGP
jgi:hypothetical protein